MSVRTAPPSPANRLARETSPYLLLHAHNPVDWYPWGPEAIARARAEDKPIFLSVGYSTCYWCHVMERESFSDPAIAAEMNRGFVNVKVDREERPDLDEIYMLATQMLTGQGGWPNSIFLTPRLEPFFAGTYFPPEDRWGRPGFPTVLTSMLHAWGERRADVETQAAELAEGIRHHLAEVPPESGPLPGAELAAAAADRLRERFDGTHGGFGEAPKFPSPANFWLLGELATGRADAALMLEATLGAMARGGIYDQLGGGFHRYATDREWKVPHFEKMLYDNGLLLETYAREHGRSGDPEVGRIALAVAEFLGREMSAPEGAFWSAIDAETDGHEGIYYVWTRAELDGALGAEDAEFLAPILGFAGEPFFEEHHYVLHLPRPMEVVARERRMSREELLAEVSPLAERLLDARSKRPRPATDDKILADWNGTAIAGLATAGRLLRRPDLVARAARAAEFVLGALRAEDGTLLHVYRGGGARIPAFLADYAFLIHGLLRLDEADPDPRWLSAASDLAAEMERRLGAPAGGFYNAAESPELLFRGKELFDGALPAANPVATLGLLDLARRTGGNHFLETAERGLRAFAPLARRHPDGARALAVALARFDAMSKLGGGGVVADRGGGRPAPPEPMKTSSAAPLSALDQEALGAIDARLELGESAEDGWRQLTIRMEVRAGWHLSPVAGGSEGAALRIEGSAAELDGFTLPGAGPVAPGGPGGLSGRLALRGRVRALRADRAASLSLCFRPCAGDRCLPEQRLELPLPA